MAINPFLEPRKVRVKIVKFALLPVGCRFKHGRTWSVRLGNIDYYQSKWWNLKPNTFVAAEYTGFYKSKFNAGFIPLWDTEKVKKSKERKV